MRKKQLKSFRGQCNLNRTWASQSICKGIKHLDIMAVMHQRAALYPGRGMVTSFHLKCVASSQGRPLRGEGDTDGHVGIWDSCYKARMPLHPCRRA
jgi:hypothetical protein